MRTDSQAPATRRDGSVVALAFACLLVALELAGAYGPLASVLPFSGFRAVLAVAVLVVLGTAPHWWRKVPVLPLGAMTIYVVAVGASALASALSPTVTAAGVTDVLEQLVFLVVVTLLVTAAPARTRWPALAVAVVAPLALLSGLAVLDEWVLGGVSDFGGFEVTTTALGVGTLAPRHAGALPDANFWGRFLALGLPFGLALMAVTPPALDPRLGERSRRALARRLGWVVPSRRVTTSVAVALIAGGLYLTGSRGAFIAAGLGTLLFALAAGVSVRRILWSLPPAVLALAVPGVGSRLFSSFPVGGAAQQAGADGSVVERLATQQVALRMIEADPLTGVGPDGYVEAFARTAATTDLTLTRVVAPHNLYLGLWAETGLFGLLGWLAVVGVAVAVGLRALAHATGAADPSVRRLRPYAAAGVASLVAWSAASVFLHLTYVRVLLVVVALTAVLDREVLERVAGAEATDQPDASRALERRSAARSRVGRWAALGATLGLLGAFGGSLLAGHDTQATLSGWLVPVDDGTYALALRTRSAVLPTFAVAVGSAADPRVGAQGGPSSGLVTLTARDRSGRSAVALVEQAADRAPAVLARTGLDRFYRLQWSEPRTSSGHAVLAAAGAGVVGAVVGALCGAVAAVRRIRVEVGR